MLIIRFSAIGDVVLTTPLIRWLRERFPEAGIDFLTKEAYHDLLANHPGISEVLPFPSGGGMRDLFKTAEKVRTRNYDAVVDLQANFRSKWITAFSKAGYKKKYRPQRWQRFLLVRLHRNTYRNIQPVSLRYLACLSGWNIRDDGLGAALFPSEAETAGMLEKTGSTENKSFLVFAPGATHWTKRWPAAYYHEVAAFFCGLGLSVMVVGGKNDTSACLEVCRGLPETCRNLCGRLSLMETAALIKRARAVVTNDTGVMHITGAVGTPVVCVFGPTTVHLGFFPFRSDSTVIEDPGLSCRPCSFHGTSQCPRKHFRCMKEIRPEQVIRAVREKAGL
ncbi:lipopolysaccharide heptosyltransferase II [bacterium]|nr:lipopolysaccharide heptosyltransferase II [bacterium]